VPDRIPAPRPIGGGAVALELGQRPDDRFTVERRERFDQLVERGSARTPRIELGERTRTTDSFAPGKRQGTLLV
jgi:hypothetical protein